MTRILVHIALRNVLRYGKRTLITALVLTVGIGMFILGDSVLAGMDRMTIDSMVEFSESSLMVMNPLYKENMRGFPLEPEYGIPESKAVIERVSQILPEARAITPRTQFAAIASNRIDSLPVFGTIVEPESDARVFGIATNLSEGSWFPALEEATPDRQIVLGKALAKDLGLATGDWLILSARAVDDSLNADEYLITGIVDIPAQQISQSGIFISYGAAKELLGEDLPVTTLAIALPRSTTLDDELAKSEIAFQTLISSFPNLTGISIQEAAGDYLAMRTMKAKYSNIIILVVLLIAGVGIVNTILMSVFSRIKEIGVLRAYGMFPAQIRRLFSLEGLMIGTIGSLGGVLLGCFGVWATIQWGIPLDKLMGNIDMGGIPLGGKLQGEWHPATIAIGFIFGVLASWISARIPASKAATFEITDALRFV
jgi:putative ABC transport system permease protein